MNKSILKAIESDLPRILDVQKCAFAEIAKAMGNDQIQPLRQTIQELQCEWKKGLILKYISDNQIVGSIRSYVDSSLVCHVGKLVVHPDYQHRGIGEALLREIEVYNFTCLKFALFTSENTSFTWRLYQKVGYQIVGKEDMGGVLMLIMEKSTSLLCKNKEFGRIDYADSYAAHSSRKMTVDEAISVLFQLPKWVSVLLKIRDVLVRPFGLKLSEASQMKEHYEIGEKASIFVVSDRDDREIMMNENDSHLNFCVSVVADGEEGTDVKLTTVVHFNNRFGRFYFFMIRPFHGLIVRRSVKQIRFVK